MKIADWWSRAELGIYDSKYEKTPFEDGHVQSMLHEAISLVVIKKYDHGIGTHDMSKARVQIRRDGYVDLQAAVVEKMGSAFKHKEATTTTAGTTTAGATTGTEQNHPKPPNWSIMTKTQRRHWNHRHQKKGTKHDHKK